MKSTHQPERDYTRDIARETRDFVNTLRVSCVAAQDEIERSRCLVEKSRELIEAASAVARAGWPPHLRHR